MDSNSDQEEPSNSLNHAGDVADNDSDKIWGKGDNGFPCDPVPFWFGFKIKNFLTGFKGAPSRKGKRMPSRLEARRGQKWS